MSDDLLTRLGFWPKSGLHPDCYKAALADFAAARDRIEALEAENARLRGALEGIHKHADVIPMMRLSQEKRGIWEMAIEGAGMHVRKAARAALTNEGSK